MSEQTQEQRRRGAEEGEEGEEEEDEGEEEGEEEEQEGEDDAEEEKNALKSFCNAMMQRRSVKSDNAASLKRARDERHAATRELLQCMETSRVSCLQWSDGAAPRYVRRVKKYTVKVLSDSTLRACLNGHLDDDDDDDDGDDGADAAKSDALALRIVKAVSRRRTKQTFGVKVEDKKPRAVQTSELLVVGDGPPAVASSVAAFCVAKERYARAMQEHRELLSMLVGRASQAMPVVARYMERTEQMSQPIVLSQNNNEKMCLRRKTLVKRPPVRMSLLRESLQTVLEDLRTTKCGGEGLTRELLRAHRDTWIEDVIKHVNANRPVFQSQVVRLDKARRSSSSS